MIAPKSSIIAKAVKKTFNDIGTLDPNNDKTPKEKAMSVADGIAELDDSAVLRWMQSLVEPHHLIRNVRRATVDEKIARELHTKAASIWSKREGNRARRIEAHHRLNSGDELDTEWLVESVAKISLEDSAILYYKRIKLSRVF